jgi:hypothetical protein
MCLGIGTADRETIVVKTKARTGQEDEPMIWVVLGALGIPVWAVIGGLLWALWSHRIHKRAPGVFPCKVRAISGARGSEGWGRRTAYARWVHDVLLVHSGLPLISYQAMPVRDAQEPVSLIGGEKAKGLSHPVSVRMTLDDGSIHEVATSASSAGSLPGPLRAFAR